MERSYNVAVVRERFLSESELSNYAGMESFEVTAIGSYGTEYSGSLPVSRLPSAASVPTAFLERAAQALVSGAAGSSTYMYGLVDELADYDIAHTVETFHGFSEQAVEARDRHGCAVVATVWENIPYFSEDGHYSRTPKERIKHREAPRIKERVRDNVDCFMPVTSQAAHALRVEGVPDSRIETVPIGVDAQVFRPGVLASSDRDATAFGLEPVGDALNVVFVGRYTWEKGVFDLLSAWKTVVSEAERRVHLTMIGGGDGLEKVRGYAEHASVDGAEIRGPVSYADVPLVFDAADVVVVPSLPARFWQEQYGRVILEAQACGTPVLASRVGGIPDAMGDVGVLHQPGEPLDIATKLLELLSEDDRREELGEAGRERILRERTLEHTRERVERVYRKVLDND